MQTLALSHRDFPPRLRQLIEAELDGTETITWVGAPIPRLLAMKSIPIVLFGIPWTAFAVYWIAGAAGFQMPDFEEGLSFFPLFGIPFVLIGLSLLASPFLMVRKAKKTAYVLTTKRAIIFDGGFSTTIRSFNRRRLTDLRRKQRADGSGDLIFERKVPYDGAGRQTTDHGFMAISDVKMVEDRVRQLTRSSAK